MSKRNIIYVSGYPGSGKTTIFKKLKRIKRLICIDMDDVYDEIYKKNKTSDKIDDYVDDYVDKKHKQSIKEKKYFVMVGAYFNPTKYAYKKYGLYLESPLIYIRRFGRELDKFIKNKTKIMKLLKSKKDVKQIDDEITYSIGIKTQIPISYDKMIQDYDMFYSTLENDGFEIYYAKDLLKEIKNKI